MEDANIDRSIKVRGGIYTAKAKEGRYIYKNPPFGYYKVGERKERRLVINEKEAAVVRFIYDSFIKGVPIYLIVKQARERGLRRSGNVAIQRILSYPLYAGMQYVQPFKNYPGGLFPANHDPIIDLATWEQVQRKLKKPEKEKVVVSDDMPLRGVLKCYCGKPLTGAPSKGKLGKYYNYYKCNKTTHLNLSAIKAHDQLRQVFGLMSLPNKSIVYIRKNADRMFEAKMVEDKQLLIEKKRELDAEEAKLFSVEEKWIANKITHDTYERWFSNITSNRIALKASIERLSSDQDRTYSILQKNIDKLSDLEYVFTHSNTLQKQELVNLGFERNLYYQDGMYRTPTMIEMLSHNYLIMNEKGLLEWHKKRGNFSIPPLSGLGGGVIEPLVPLLVFLDELELG